MHFTFTSKTFKLTEELKDFFTVKLDRLKKFASLGIEEVSVVLDKVKRHSNGLSQVSVEVLVHTVHETFRFEEQAENVKQAFFRVYEKAEQTLLRKSDQQKG